MTAIQKEFPLPELYLVFKPLREIGFKDVCLHVVRVELGLGLLVFLELRAHVFGDLLFFSLHLLNDSIVVFLLALVLVFNLGHLLTDGSQLFNAWRQLRLLLLHPTKNRTAAELL